MVSVSMAYFLGPLLGGEISQYIGFSWLMSVIGLANIFYGIYLMRTVLFVSQPEVNKTFFLYKKIRNELVFKPLPLFFPHRVTPIESHHK